VVLCRPHNGEGAMGVVLQPAARQAARRTQRRVRARALAGVALFQGGPVQTEQLLLAAWQRGRTGFACTSASDRTSAPVCSLTKHARAAFLGYSGWSAGQLENEMQHRTGSSRTCRKIC